jgi:hypothetical protein
MRGRDHRRRATIGMGLAIAALVVVAAACTPLKQPAPAPAPGPPPPPPGPPPAPTQFCGASFGSPSQYKNSFHNLTHAGTGWLSADAFVPAPNTNGTTAWWMADTINGTLSGHSVATPTVASNSLVEQAGSCLTPRVGGTATQPVDLIPRQSGQWFWPGSSFADGGTMYVFGWTAVPAPGPPGFGYRITGTAMARFAMPSLDYLGRTQLSTMSSNEDVPWGIRTFKGSDGFVYLYGTAKISDSSSPLGLRAEVYVARATIANLGNQAAWEFWTAIGWSQVGPRVPMLFVDQSGLPTDAPLAQPSVVPNGTGYLAVSLDVDGFGQLGAWTSTAPQGPWQRAGVVASHTPESSGQLSYDGRIADLPGAGRTVVYSVNDPENNTENVDLYGGRFVPPAIPIP